MEPDSKETEELLSSQLANKTLQDIKRHVVQIETIGLFIILFQALLSLRQPLATLIGPAYSFLLPFAFLAFLPFLIRETNPGDTVRSIVKYGTTGFGVGATIGGGITGTLTGGLGAPAGALIGGGIGLVIGAISGPFIDREKKTETFTQGEARKFLIKEQKKYSSLSIETIVEATKYPYDKGKPCTIYTFPIDGVITCTKEDVLKWLKSQCWQHVS